MWCFIRIIYRNSKSSILYSKGALSIMKKINNPDLSLPFHIRGAFRGFETALSRYLAELNVPLSQFYILRLQWNKLGSPQNEIAQKSCMSESVASQVIQKMEKDGLLKRKLDPADSRMRRVLLTPKGKILRGKILKKGIQLSTNHGPKISREDMLTTISVLIEVKKAFDSYNAE